MQLCLNVFQQLEIQGTAEIIAALGSKKVTCTLSEQNDGHNFVFYVWVGDITAFHHPNWSQHNRISSEIRVIAQIIGESFDRLKNVCEPLIGPRTLRKSPSGIHIWQ